MPVLAIFAGGCAQNIPSPTDASIIIKQVCEPIYGRASDWDSISDDLARNIYRHNLVCEKLFTNGGGD